MPEIPGYIVDRVLSRAGGTGIVYFGINLRNGFPVAIKQLYASRAQNPAIVEAFRNEAINYVYVQHPCITKLVDFVEQNGTCYLIMEFLKGQTLDAYQRAKTGPMPDEIAVPIIMKVLETVGYIHNVSTPFSPNGMLHLDIKPSNIMIGDNLSVKVMDMGISSTISNHNTNQRVCGTPAFMPPEQAHRGQLGPYTDIFAIGVTFYSMLVAHLPFVGNSTQEIWRKIETGTYPELSHYYPYVNKRFEPIIRKALDPNPALRYQTCASMAMDINKAISH